MWPRHLLAIAFAASPATIVAQSPRENAVAIDRVPFSSDEPYGLEQIGPPMASPWSLAFLPDGSFLVSEKHGGVRIIAPNGRISAPLDGGPPAVLRKSDSGLLDIVLDPEFADNKFIYLAFVEGDEAANRTAIWKARLDGDRMRDGRVIFRVNEPKQGEDHPGGRMLFLPDKTLLLTVGDGFALRDKAQDIGSHLGKVLRLTRDGFAAPDNPFVGRNGYREEIWTLGHRNIQGLTLDSVTGTVWAHEHGPRGGDEINELSGGRNYGWPLASNGIDYDGTLITSTLHVDGMADPRFFWAPSIAPSGLAIYHGKEFPQLEGRFLVGSLAARALVQIRIGSKTGLLAEEGRFLDRYKERIRDVRVSPDGRVYLLTDGDSGRLLRLVPASEPNIAADSPLSPLSGLVGRWQGTSRFVPAFQNERVSDESSEIECLPILKATYIRCSARFFRPKDGRTRINEKSINVVPGKPGFQVVHLDSNWHGRSEYTLEWDPTEMGWAAYLETDFEGKPAIERIFERLAPDGSTLLHTESLRLKEAPAAAWTETFRWTWTRR